MKIRQRAPHLTSSDHNPDQGGVICAGAFHRIVEPLSKEGRAVQGTLHWKWERLQTWNHDLTKMSTHQLHLSLPAAFDHFLCNYLRNLRWVAECSPPWFFSASIFLSSCIRQSTFILQDSLWPVNPIFSPQMQSLRILNIFPP